jgi:hypothetical protein
LLFLTELKLLGRVLERKAQLVLYIQFWIVLLNFYRLLLSAFLPCERKENTKTGWFDPQAARIPIGESEGELGGLLF